MLPGKLETRFFICPPCPASRPSVSSPASRGSRETDADPEGSLAKHSSSSGTGRPAVCLPAQMIYLPVASTSPNFAVYFRAEYERPFRAFLTQRVFVFFPSLVLAPFSVVPSFVQVTRRWGALEGCCLRRSAWGGTSCLKLAV